MKTFRRKGQQSGAGVEVVNEEFKIKFGLEITKMAEEADVIRRKGKKVQYGVLGFQNC